MTLNHLYHYDNNVPPVGVEGLTLMTGTAMTVTPMTTDAQI